MHDIFNKLNRKRKYQKHPNSKYFFFGILNMYSPIKYFYWWGNIAFIIIYYFILQIDNNIKITNVSKTVDLGLFYNSVNDAMSIFTILTIILLGIMTLFFKRKNDDLNIGIKNSINWINKTEKPEDEITTNDLNVMKRLLSLFVLMCYILIPFLYFRDISDGSKLSYISQSTLGNFIFLESLHIFVLYVFSSHIFLREV
ncbi:MULTISPECIES: hypothetical protein [Moraxella]|uniref:Uncharacterized protein n=1 Tax=Moraxella lacunata TaxID=477 RepID=A0A1B8Q5K8_MORLA|nr:MULTISPECIES: hypothetical protein [Moraxella]MBE9579266.1 hypothetical protein [Moraxella sp. K1664]MBE9588044.1 hypothetical protein [Moraxella sp. K1630]MBE9595419.1 hypothetical protein [Moraxella sp. K2450]MDH9219390.1 hypothetical protein [Moraxella lacunata]MDI4483350.1 hypothetical protein [Moraxella lacunata]